MTCGKSALASETVKVLGGTSGAKGGAAAAGLLGVGVVELKPAAHEAVLEVDRHAVEVQMALRVDENFDSVLLKDLVVLLRGRLIEGEDVRHPRAAAALDPNAQAEIGLLLLGDELFHLLRCRRCECNHWSSRASFLCDWHALL